MKRSISIPLACGAALALLAASLAAATPMATTEAAALFVRRVQPMLQEKCLACHGRDEEKIKGGLDLRTLASTLGLITSAVRRDRHASQVFIRILAHGRDPQRTLTLMTEAGVLGRYLPEFGRIVAQMQFNMYHSYTVDEHTLRAVGVIADIAAGRFVEDHPLSTTVMPLIADREALFLAMLLHDTGKALVPDNILNKPGPLTDEERAVMEQHTIEGERLLLRVGGLLGEIGRVVRSCHERWDGKGYPDGLAGERIPLLARIVSCCDAYNAMTSDRSYRKALSQEVALSELRAGRGTQFDPQVVDALIAALTR